MLWTLYTKCATPSTVCILVNLSIFIVCSLFRAQGLNLAAFRSCAGIAPFSSHTEDKSSNSQHHGFTLDSWISSNICQPIVHFSNHFSVGNRSLSSEAGAKSGGEEDDVEEGFSELEAPEASETTGKNDESSDSSSDSESDLSNVDENMEENLETELMGDAEMVAGGAESTKNWGPSPLLKLILDASGQAVSDVLDRYVAEGKDVSRTEAYQVLLNLRRRKMYVKSLQVRMLKSSTSFGSDFLVFVQFPLFNDLFLKFI